jgi:hypothetical protein
MRIALLLTVLLALAGGIGSAAPDASCSGAAPRGSFAETAGSAGARSISHALRPRNVSATTCTVSGLPQVRLSTARTVLSRRTSRRCTPGC